MSFKCWKPETGERWELETMEQVQEAMDEYRGFAAAQLRVLPKNVVIYGAEHKDGGFRFYCINADIEDLNRYLKCGRYKSVRYLIRPNVCQGLAV